MLELKRARKAGFDPDHAAAHVLTPSKSILTTGGQSYPGSGTTGDGYRFAAQLGHTIVPPRPALVPLTTTAPWVAELRGITLPDVAVRILEDGRRSWPRAAARCCSPISACPGRWFSTSAGSSAAIPGRKR